MSPPYGFKTPQGQTEFLAAYDAELARWPVPFEELDIPSRFGMTHVVVSGPKGAPPLVLLHGYQGTALMWSPNIAALSRDHRVYAVDVMGQPGETIPSDPIRNAADYVAWLTDTLNGLGLDRVFLAGMSFGGWLALTYAAALPARVAKLVLLSPGGLLPIARQFVLRGMLMMLIPARSSVKWFMRWAGFQDAPGRNDLSRMYNLMSLGMKHFRTPKETLRIPALPLSDAELHGLRMPVLLLIGDREVLCDPKAAFDRARRLIPDFTGELLPGSHDMYFSQRVRADSRVLEFLARGRAVRTIPAPEAELAGRIG